MRSPASLDHLESAVNAEPDYVQRCACVAVLTATDAPLHQLLHVE